MSRPSVESLFRGLDLPETSGTLVAVSIPAWARFHVARDEHGDPYLLIEAADQLNSASGGALRLAHFRYIARADLTIRFTGSTESRPASVAMVGCAEADSDLRALFFRLAEGLIDHLGASPSAEQVHSAVLELVEIFRSLSMPGKGTAQGLWAELLVIARSLDPVAAVSAWHDDPSELHDFVADLERVEIKSTTKDVRLHDVSLDQLREAGDARVFIVSLMLTPSDIGTSVGSLVDEILARLPRRGESRRRVISIVAKTLGESWRDREGVRFDRAAAEASLRVFRARDVPSVAASVPPEVSRVSFRVDLSAVAPAVIAGSNPLLQRLLAVESA